MTKEEAKEWLEGQRSTTNMIPSDPDGYGLTWEVRIAQADAAMMQQAYWTLRAHSEGLIPNAANDGRGKG